MSDTIKFNIKLNIDGKDVIVQASESIKELQKNIASARTETQKATASFINFNQHIAQLQNLSGVVSQFASTLNSITGESRSFSAAMASANTMAGKSGEDFTKLKGEVADLAKTVPVARDALANGLYQVVSNGVPENNWIEFLNKSAKSSVGGIADLGEVVKVTSTMIKNYGLSWDAAGAIQDKIQLTAKNGVTSFEQLAQALPRVGANAATLGVSIDELMASFATLTGVSGNTAEVSTQLAAVFTALIKPSTEAQKTADLLGIKFDAASVKAAGGLQNFLKALNTAVQQYSAKTGILSQEIYGKLFGSAESLRALTPLMGELSSKFDDNIEAMKNSAGTMDDAFNTMANTGASKMQLLKNKIAELTDSITNGLAPVLPLLNITAQVGMSISAIAQLVTVFKNFSLVSKIATQAGILWKTMLNGITVSTTAASVATNIFKNALRALAVGSVIGIAITAIGIALEKLVSAFSDAGDSAKKMGNKVQQTTDTLEDHKNRALAPVASKYDELKSKWETLKTTQEKNEFIKNNSNAFSDLGISINSVGQAEDFFVKNTNNVVKAMDMRAEAAANAAMAAEDMQKALAAEDKARQINQRNRTKYKQQHHTGHTEQDLQLDLMVDNGDLRVTSREQRKAEQEAKDARKRVTERNKRTVELQKQADKTLKRYPQSNGASSLSGESNHLNLSGSGNSGHTGHKISTNTNHANTNVYQKGSIAQLNQQLDALRKKRESLTDPTAIANVDDEIRKVSKDIDKLNMSAKDISFKRDVKALGIDSFDEKSLGSFSQPTVTPKFDDKDFKSGLDSLSEKIKNVFDSMREESDNAAENLKNLRSSLGGNVTQTIDEWKSLGVAFKQGGDAATGAGGAMVLLGQSLQNVAGDGAAAKAGAVMAAIGQLVLGFATALAKDTKLGVLGWIGMSIAGAATLASLISTIQGFSTGGIVGGSSYRGDKIPARVNSGEMILTMRQQKQLFSIANGDIKPKVGLPSYQSVTPSLHTAGNLTAIPLDITIHGKTRGTDTLYTLQNARRRDAKFGKRWD